MMNPNPVTTEELKTEDLEILARISVLINAAQVLLVMTLGVALLMILIGMYLMSRF